MKTQLGGKLKSVVLLISSGLMFGIGGNCVPQDFWARTWDNTLTTAVDTVYAAYVLDPLINTLVPPADE